MNRKLVISIVTWISTVVTLVLWLPVIAFAVIMLKDKLLSTQASSIGIIGGVDGPTAVFVAGSGFITSIGDYLVILVAGLIITLLLWFFKIKLKTKK